MNQPRILRHSFASFPFACAALIGLLAIAGLSLAAESKSPAEEFKALQRDAERAQQEFQTAYSKAKTEDERQKIFREKYPKPETLAPKFLALAETHPEDPAAVDALVWVLTRAGRGPQAESALKILKTHHLTSPKLTAVVESIWHGAASGLEEFLQLVIEKNPHKAVQGKASFSLAKYLERFPNRAAQSEKLFESVVEKYADVPHWRGTLGDAAKAELFELRHLAIGKVAPEIEGEDLDGNRFKLSEYRGKVVVLDFWGDW